jgi:hypothetical protein
VKAFKIPLLLAALAAAALAVGGQSASAAKPPLLYGTTGACNNAFPGGPCTQTSELFQLDPTTGAAIKDIGPVGFTVNGLAWDTKTDQMFASTAIGDVAFHGLITIDLATGAGTPVDPTVHNFGLDGADSPIHSITFNTPGRMAGWYDEAPAPGVTDTFVRLDKGTGIATEFTNTGIDTAQNGLSFDKSNKLWNIDTTRRQGPGTPLTQVAYQLDPNNGQPIRTVSLSPPTMAALGDFNPVNDLYYGLNFQAFTIAPTFLEVVDLGAGTVRTIGQTVDDLHTLAFRKK